MLYNLAEYLCNQWGNFTSFTKNMITTLLGQPIVDAIHSGSAAAYNYLATCADSAVTAIHNLFFH